MDKYSRKQIAKRVVSATQYNGEAHPFQTSEFWRLSDCYETSDGRFTGQVHWNNGHFGILSGDWIVVEQGTGVFRVPEHQFNDLFCKVLDNEKDSECQQPDLSA
jgi:hypothetical protein